MFFKVMHLVLTEKSLVIYGTDKGYITAICLAIKEIIQPLHWEVGIPFFEYRGNNMIILLISWELKLLDCLSEICKLLVLFFLKRLHHSLT